MRHAGFALLSHPTSKRLSLRVSIKGSLRPVLTRSPRPGSLRSLGRAAAASALALDPVPSLLLRNGYRKASARNPASTEDQQPPICETCQSCVLCRSPKGLAVGAGPVGLPRSGTPNPARAHAANLNRSNLAGPFLPLRGLDMGLF